MAPTQSRLSKQPALFFVQRKPPAMPVVMIIGKRKPITSTAHTYLWRSENPISDNTGTSCPILWSLQADAGSGETALAFDCSAESLRRPRLKADSSSEIRISGFHETVLYAVPSRCRYRVMHGRPAVRGGI